HVERPALVEMEQLVGAQPVQVRRAVGAAEQEVDGGAGGARAAERQPGERQRGAVALDEEPALRVALEAQLRDQLVDARAAHGRITARTSARGRPPWATNASWKARRLAPGRAVYSSRSFWICSLPMV